jgi:hypothetical protein
MHLLVAAEAHRKPAIVVLVAAKAPQNHVENFEREEKAQKLREGEPSLILPLAFHMVTHPP